MPESELERLIDAILYATGQTMTGPTHGRFARFLAERVATANSVRSDRAVF